MIPVDRLGMIIAFIYIRQLRTRSAGVLWLLGSDWGIIVALRISHRTAMNCHQCGEIVTVDDRFCEECGVNLVINPTAQAIDPGCQKCGAPPSKIDPDRYCIECGFRQVAISNETIELQPAPNLAGASDRGRRHHQNEDAIALKLIAPDTYAIVVCDGVSSSQHPELASQAAVTSCLQAIEIAIADGSGTTDPATAIRQDSDRSSLLDRSIFDDDRHCHCAR
jgi:hypothetical protein